MSSNGEGPPGRQTVADPEEFNQQRRLRSIHDARDRARATYEATQDPSIGVDQGTLAANFRATVENYVSELEGLLKQYDFDDEEMDYWEDIPLGEVVIPPPAELQQLVQSNEVTVIGGATLDPKTHAITGLRGYLEANVPFEESFSLPVRQRHKGQRTVSAAVSMEMPIVISDRARRAANDFFRMVGLDVEIRSEEHRAVITDELMDDLREWRQQNVNNNR